MPFQSIFLLTLALSPLDGRGGVHTATVRGAEKLRPAFFSPRERKEGAGRQTCGGSLVGRRTYR